MRALLTFVVLMCLAVSATAADFSARWEMIRQEASPEQLYRFLYALPKGADLHNHFGGSLIPEWKWDILTDSTRNGGDTFYARERFDAAEDAINPQV